MSYEDRIIEKSEKEYESKIEKTLKIATEISKEHKFIYDEKTDRLYEYLDNYYQVVKIGDRGSALHRVVVSYAGGEKLKIIERNNIINNIEMLSFIPDSHFNNTYLNFNNVIFDTSSMTIKEHSQDYICTNRIPYNYDPNAKCPLFLDFLDYVLNNDKNKINILQEFSGYCLTNNCKYEKSLFIVGTGQNGKGTFTNTILNMLGKDNVSAAGLEDISDPCARAALINKLLNIDTEVDRGAEKFETIFRKVASGEDTLYNEKYIPPYSKAISTKLMFSANKMPRITAESFGFYRRMLLVTFDVDVPEDKKDIELKEKILLELPGVLNWALSGLERLNSNKKFSITPYMEKEVNQLMSDNNPVAQYIEECIQFKFEGKDFGEDKIRVFHSYVFWCKQHGYYSLSFRKFNKEFFDISKNYTIKDGRRITEKRENFWPNVHIVECTELDIKRDHYGL